jgi:alkyl hydroperoxide reductase subunit AhpC
MFEAINYHNKKDMSLVRKPAPQFSGNSWYQNNFQTIKLEDYKGKYLVLFFYPLDFTFVCPT